MRIRKVEAAAQKAKLQVAVYCRVSTKRTDQEDSLEAQQIAYLDYIKANPDWVFAGLYSDSRSGLNAGKREGFMRMIADACAGKINLILCKSISRFSRNIVECQRYTEMLRSKNVAVVFEKEHIRTDAPASRLIFSLMCAIAQDESRSISENMKTANRHRVEAGICLPHKNQILGYSVEDGKLVPNQDAWIILHIFSRYAEGAGMMQICRELNEKGARRQRVEKPFTHQIIRCILGNESYVGDKRLQKQAPKDFLTKRPDPIVPYATHYLTDHHEAIVSRALWNAVQERLKQEENARKEGVRRQGNSHELYGRIICGGCGAPYMRRTVTSHCAVPGEKVHSKIWCCKGKITGSGCKNPNIREDVLLRRVAGGGKAIINREGEVVAMM
ncbi:MAG: recombinase family protein [Clostridiales bacterium]|nr:recombinase family protein [Clostridiales bacterium]